MLAWPAVSVRRTSQVLRTALVSLMVALITVPLVSSRAVGQESMTELEARMDELQGELNAAQARIEELRVEQLRLDERLAGSQARADELESKQAKLRTVVTKRAQELYMAGNSEMLETLLGSSDMGELMDRTEVLSQVSRDDSSAFLELARSQAELEQLNAQMSADRSRLVAAEEQLAEENDVLQSRFEEVSDEYDRLKAALAKATPAPAPAAASGPAPAAPVVKSTGGMACPVAGPVSFTDTWGAPRSNGRSHEGTDMMAAYGTPVAAITSGTITYSAYNGSGGYMIFLSGDDGNQYWYLHNQENFVSSGARVSTGDIIASVGDTGNATGTPHVHFEYHPGGGGPVNPYPLVASLC